MLAFTAMNPLHVFIIVFKFVYVSMIELGWGAIIKDARAAILIPFNPIN